MKNKYLDDLQEEMEMLLGIFDSQTNSTCSPQVMVGTIKECIEVLYAYLKEIRNAKDD